MGAQDDPGEGGDWLRGGGIGGVVLDTTKIPDTVTAPGILEDYIGPFLGRRDQPPSFQFASRRPWRQRLVRFEFSNSSGSGSNSWTGLPFVVRNVGEHRSNWELWPLHEGTGHYWPQIYFDESALPYSLMVNGSRNPVWLVYRFTRGGAGTRVLDLMVFEH